jgi:DNA-binding MarR family transcriptional regulator
MPIIRETVELLVQAAGACNVSDNRRGLRDREWAALRFLARANRFSKSPSALAHYIGATRATATQLIKMLEDRSYVVRRSSLRDKRSVILCVTAQGERLLTQHDPINSVVHAIAALVAEDRVQLKNSLNAILNRIDSPYQQVNAGVCRDCIFLGKSRATTGPSKARANDEFRCRLLRAPLAAHETELLCTRIERARRG